MSGVPQTDQQPCQPQEAPQDQALSSRRGSLSLLSQGLPQQVLPVDPHQLLSPWGQVCQCPGPSQCSSGCQ